MRGLIFLMACLIGPAAFAASADDIGAAQSIISAQEQAFARDDAATAYSFASPALQTYFRNPDGFMSMVRGGYAPVYRETALDLPEMSAIRAAVRQLLVGHEPYPALVVDGTWNLIEANAAFAVFTESAASELLATPCNVLRLALHPEGLAPRTVNLGEWRAHILRRLRRAVIRSGDADLARLLEELRAYPCDQPEPDAELPGPGDVAVPLRICHGDRQLAFIAIIAAFGTPLDITVAELVIESFFPADPDTAAFLAERARRR